MTPDEALAVNRFGLGARPDEVDAAGGRPRRWLLQQVEAGPEQPQSLDDIPLQSGGSLVAELSQIRRARRMVRDGAGSANNQNVVAAFKRFGSVFRQEIVARTALGFTTDRPFAERLVWFWSNHFTVSRQNGALALVGAYEREAIRPNINRKFEDMLLAVVTHPAMQLYLNNTQSIGPDSPAGLRTGKGINENLGREMMELHTLGVDGGYTQADVIALAMLLTGWSIDLGGATNGFRFYPARHEPGEIVFRGKTYPAGEAGGRMAVHDLAHDPATARHIAKQFATHFIADDPPAASVARLEDTFARTGGDLAALAQTLVDDEAAWRPALRKMRSPIAYVTATYRFFGWLGRDAVEDKQVAAALGAMRLMGQMPLSAPSPKGWPQRSDAWSGADAVLNRIEWARAIGNKMPNSFNAIGAAETMMGPLLRPATRKAMAGLRTGEAIALLFASPEFQRC